MYKNCAGGIYVRKVVALVVLVKAVTCDLFKSTWSSFYLFFLVQSETNTAEMDCIVLTSDHTVFFAQFCWYLLPNHDYTKDLRLGTIARCDVIIKVLSQTLVPPTPRMVHTQLGRSFGTSIHIWEILKPLYSFLPGNQFIWATCWLTQVNSFSLLCPPEDLIPPPVMPQNLQVHFQLTWWSANLRSLLPTDHVQLHSNPVNNTIMNILCFIPKAQLSNSLYMNILPKFQ